MDSLTNNRVRLIEPDTDRKQMPRYIIQYLNIPDTNAVVCIYTLKCVFDVAFNLTFPSSWSDIFWSLEHSIISPVRM